MSAGRLSRLADRWFGPKLGPVSPPTEPPPWVKDAARHMEVAETGKQHLVLHPQFVDCRNCGKRHRITRIEAVFGTFRVFYDCSTCDAGEQSIEWKAEVVASITNACIRGGTA